MRTKSLLGHPHTLENRNQREMVMIQSYYVSQDTSVLEDLKLTRQELDELAIATFHGSDSLLEWSQAQGQYEKSLAKGRILAMMGTINLITFKLALAHGALRQTTFGKEVNKFEVDSQKLRNLVVGCAREQISFTMPLCGLTKYLKRYWPGACASRSFLVKLRRIMSYELGLFEFEEVKWQKLPDNERAAPAVITAIDFEKLLVVQNLLENMLAALVEWEDGEEQQTVLSLLPSHCGNWTRMLYDAWFAGVAEYRRSPEPVIEFPCVDEDWDEGEDWADEDCFWSSE